MPAGFNKAVESSDNTRPGKGCYFGCVYSTISDFLFFYIYFFSSTIQIAETCVPVFISDVENPKAPHCPIVRSMEELFFFSMYPSLLLIGDCHHGTVVKGVEGKACSGKLA